MKVLNDVFMGAWPWKIMHPALQTCAPQIMLILFSEFQKKNCAPARCTPFNTMHLVVKICTLGTVCTHHFEHCIIKLESFSSGYNDVYFRYIHIYINVHS